MYLSHGFHGATRGMDLPTREAKLSEIWQQLCWLEEQFGFDRVFGCDSFRDNAIKPPLQQYRLDYREFANVHLSRPTTGGNFQNLTTRSAYPILGLFNLILNHFQ